LLCFALLCFALLCFALLCSAGLPCNSNEMNFYSKRAHPPRVTKNQLSVPDARLKSHPYGTAFLVRECDVFCNRGGLRIQSNPEFLNEQSRVHAEKKQLGWHKKGGE
jgi:hypothetical protein